MYVSIVSRIPLEEKHVANHTTSPAYAPTLIRCTAGAALGGKLPNSVMIESMYSAGVTSYIGFKTKRFGVSRHLLSASWGSNESTASGVSFGLSVPADAIGFDVETFSVAAEGMSSSGGASSLVTMESRATRSVNLTVSAHT